MTLKTTYATVDGLVSSVPVPVGDGQVARSLVTLLVQHPRAWVGGMGPDALYVSVPVGPPFDGHRVLEGRWMLDHLVSADRPLLSAAWRRSQADGMATVLVELVSGGAATFHFFDVVDCYGATIIVAVEENGAGLANANQVSYPVLPRYCRVARDEGGRIIDVDDAAPLLLGWPREELIGGFPLVLFHPDDHSRLIDTWMETLSDGSNGHRCRARVLRGDGTWAWFEITNRNRLDDPDMPRVESEMLDVSEEMAAHEAVRAREQLLHRLAARLPLGVV